MRKELPALLILAVSLSACSFSYSSSRGTKPGSSAGAHGTGKPAKHAAPAADPTPAPAASTPPATAQAEPAPAPASLPAEPAADPGRVGRGDAPASAGAATLNTGAIKAEPVNAGAAKPNSGSTNLSARDKAGEPPKPSTKLAAPK